MKIISIEILKPKSLKLLKDLEDLKLIRLIPEKTQEKAEKTISHKDQETDFFLTTGLWKDREISLTSLREKAWAKK